MIVAQNYYKKTTYTPPRTRFYHPADNSKKNEGMPCCRYAFIVSQSSRGFTFTCYSPTCDVGKFRLNDFSSRHGC